MKKFRFKYENILKMRLDEEEAVKNRLKILSNKLIDQQTELQHTMSDFHVFQEKLNLQMAEGMSGAELKSIGGYQSYFRNKIQEINSEIAYTEKRIEEVKTELVEAMKERKIMEKLKEKDERVYNEEAQAAENKIVDEIVNYQSSKRGGE